jgi:hypothetical protein
MYQKRRMASRNAYHVRVLFRIDDGNVVKFDVQELVNRHESSDNREIIFEFYGDLLANKRFEERVEKLFGTYINTSSGNTKTFLSSPTIL